MSISRALGAACIAGGVLLTSGCGSLRGTTRDGLPLPPGVTAREYARMERNSRLLAGGPPAPERPARRYRGIAMAPPQQPWVVGGSAIQIDGARQLSPTPGTNFVVSLWVRCDRAPTAAQGYVAVIGKYSEAQPTASRWLLGLNTNLRPFMKTSTTGGTVTANCSLQAGVWQLLVAEWASNGTTRLYVGTNLCASGSLPLLSLSDLPVTVGDTYPLSGAHALDGGIDEVRISRDRVTAASVVTIFQSAPDTDGDGIMDGNDPDDNNDGIPDEWAARYFGDRLAGAPHEDPDGDQMSNGQEYIAGTDPTEELSQFTVWDFRFVPAGASLRAQCDGVSGRIYSVWMSTNLATPRNQWTPVGTPRACSTSGVFTLSVPIAPTNKAYYRFSVRR